MTSGFSSWTVAAHKNEVNVTTLASNDLREFLILGER